MKRVVVAKYNPEWPNQFEVEAAKLRAIFGDEMVAVHHIGSTSVPGLKAKPIIDILLIVKDIRRTDQFNGQMVALGYEPCGEFGIPGRRYFRKGSDDRTHHVHAFQANNSEQIDRHLAFRDYLRTHSEDAEEYGNLKERLAAEFPGDRESYVLAKDSFVRDIEKKALAWQSEIERR